MKIALFCTTDLASPVPADIVYAPMGLFDALAAGLANAGHEVFVYSPTNTQILHADIKHISHGLKSFDAAGYQNIWGPFTHLDIATVYEQFLVMQMLQDHKTEQFDVIHFYHNITRHIALLKDIDVPIVATLHDPLVDKQKFILERCPWAGQINFVSISDSQRKGLPTLNYVDTIYNGISVHEYTFAATPEDYFVFLGRICYDKGTHIAVRIAKELGLPLRIIGPKSDQGYWDKEIAPYIGGNIEYVGMLPQKETRPIVAAAKALLMPIQWEEPFGLVMIEALAGGTPVIGFRRGSVPEVVTDGEAGYVVDSEEKMKEAIRHIEFIDRKKCRERAEAMFDTEVMVKKYENVYQKLLRKK